MKSSLHPGSAGIDLKTRIVLAILLSFAINALLPSVALAQSFQGGLPWEAATRNIACQLGGPTLKWLAVIAIVLAGIMFGLGELSGPFQRFMQIAGGFSIAVSAVSVVGWLLGSQPGACPNF